MFHDQHVSHKWNVFVIFYILLRASYGYIQCGFIPSAVETFSKYFQLFRCKNLTLNGDIFSSFRGRHVGGCQADWYVCLLGGHPYIPPYICTLLAHLYVPIYHSVPHMSWDLGASVHPICHGDFWGHWYIWQTF